jgi:hypothetical protein
MTVISDDTTWSATHDHYSDDYRNSFIIQANVVSLTIVIDDIS